MLKIGILIKKFEKLENWELRIVQEIINDDNLDLSLLIQDGRVNNQNTISLGNKLVRLFRSKNSFFKFLFSLQIKIERNLYPDKVTVHKKEIREKNPAILYADVIKFWLILLIKLVLLKSLL